MSALSQQRPVVLLSLDVEEFDIPLEYGIPVDDIAQMSVSVRGMRRLLDLFDRLDITATFFTTAVFAQREIDLFRRMAQRHEIASHGFAHSSFTPEDLARSKKVLEELSGKPVLGFRRARFEPTSREAIRSAGYRYDSSENPIWLPGRYNHFTDPRTPYWDNGLAILPISATPCLRIPLFWLAFKHFPRWITRLTSRRVLEHDNCLNIFFHPWEFDDLADYPLPWYVKRIDGTDLLLRLEEHLHWLKCRADFIPMSLYVTTLLPRPK